MTNLPVERTLLADETLRDQIAAQLAAFAEQLESDLAASLDRIDLNPALLLSDLCEFLHLREAQRREVLGPQASAFVDRLNTDCTTRPEVRSPG